MQRRESQAEGEGGKRSWTRIQAALAGSKMAAGKAGDRWSLPDAEMEKWGKGKGKNKYHHSQKFKNKPKA